MKYGHTFLQWETSLSLLIHSMWRRYFYAPAISSPRHINLFLSVHLFICQRRGTSFIRLLSSTVCKLQLWQFVGYILVMKLKKVERSSFSWNVSKIKDSWTIQCRLWHHLCLPGTTKSPTVSIQVVFFFSG